MNRKKLFVVLGLLAIVSILASGAFAYFNDKETSTGNAFTAGTLDLKVNGADENVSYTFSNMVPVHSQPNITWKLKNDGSTPGTLTIENAGVTSDELGCNDPEEDVDSTCGNPGIGDGELSSVLKLRLMLDMNCNGWNEAGDVILFNGSAKDLGSSYDVSTLNAGQEVCLNALVNWWDTDDDNKAQSDNMTLNLGFNLKGN